jgi:hypothetical protein
MQQKFADKKEIDGCEDKSERRATDMVIIISDQAHG